MSQPNFYPQTKPRIDYVQLELCRNSKHIAGDQWNQRLAQEAKRVHGYVCQVCGFDFYEFYGELGSEYIEAHHLIPLSQLPENARVRLSPQDDFRVVCSNCHRMIHRRDAPDTFEDFVALYRNQRN